MVGDFLIYYNYFVFWHLCYGLGYWLVVGWGLGAGGWGSGQAGFCGPGEALDPRRPGYRARQVTG